LDGEGWATSLLWRGRRLSKKGGAAQGLYRRNPIILVGKKKGILEVPFLRGGVTAGGKKEKKKNPLGRGFILTKNLVLCRGGVYLRRENCSGNKDPFLSKKKTDEFRGGGRKKEGEGVP